MYREYKCEAIVVELDGEGTSSVDYLNPHEIVSLGDFFLRFVTYNTEPPSGNVPISNLSLYFDVDGKFGTNVFEEHSPATTGEENKLNWSLSSFPGMVYTYSSQLQVSNRRIMLKFSNGTYAITSAFGTSSTPAPGCFFIKNNEVFGEIRLLPVWTGGSNTEEWRVGINYFDSFDRPYRAGTLYGSMRQSSTNVRNTISNVGANSPWKIFFESVEPFIESEDPYEAGVGESTGSGPGDGTFDFSSTDIPIPPLPAISAVDTGFINILKPSEAEMKALASYMWSGAFDLNNFKKIMANPIDAIIGLSIIPTAGAYPQAIPSTLVVGNISTGLSMPKCTSQFYENDCGTIQIPPKWGSYLDYSPYSKLSLYLPYVGIVPISSDDCMRGSIKVVYHVDILSGTCIVFVYCVSNRGTNGHTLYTFTGNCSCPVPVTSGQYMNAIAGGLKGAVGLAGAAVSAMTGNAAGIVSGVSNVADAFISMNKPEITRSGSFGNSAGLMGIQYPFLILNIPNMCVPGSQNKFIGYPSFSTKTLGELSGYAELVINHLENMSCTQNEAEEIKKLLEEGVIF